jgi:integrase
MKKKGPLRTVREGSVTVPIYSSSTRTGESFVVAWYEGSLRSRKSFAALPEAVAFAQKRAKELAKLGTATLALTGEELLAYRRARQLLEEFRTAKGVRTPIDVMVAAYVEAQTILGDVDLLVAAREYAILRPSAVKPVGCEKVVEEFMEAKRQGGRSFRHLKDLDYRLNRFAKAFQCPVNAIRVPDVERWLTSLQVGSRSRENYLTSLSNLVRFAERRGYVARGWIDLAQIERSRDEGEVAVFSPAEVRTILQAAKPTMVPFLAVCAFAGLRSAEASRLDWSEIGTDHIDVKAIKAKTRQRRLVPILPVLAGWLAPHRQPSGPICPFLKVDDQIGKLARTAGVKWKRNGLRHSFGTYRMAIVQNEQQVALEMGNTPGMVFAHYRAIATREMAEQWFACLDTAGIAKNR